MLYIYDVLGGVGRDGENVSFLEVEVIFVFYFVFFSVVVTFSFFVVLCSLGCI